MRTTLTRAATALLAVATAGSASVLGRPVPAVAAPIPLAAASTGGIRLNIRTGPSTAHPRVTTIPDGRPLAVRCRVSGQLIRGHERRTLVWNRLADGRYVSDANVAWRPRRPAIRTCAPAAGRQPVRPGAGRAGAPAGRTAAPTGVSASTGGLALNLRLGPGTGYARTGELPDGTRLRVTCQVVGQRISGHVRTSRIWDRLDTGRFVADAYVAWQPRRPALRTCAHAPDPVGLSPTAFIARLAGPARASMREHRVPASVTIAQAILESGWGSSGLSSVDHNYFGIKCFGTPGPIAVACRTYPTSECERSSCYRTTATFRGYRSMADSVRDHGRFLVVNPRYRPAFRYSRAPERFTMAIHRAGYATAPGYARAVISLIRQYGLVRFDAR